MAANASVTRLVRSAQGGDAVALQKLWERYFPRLVALARGKLDGRYRRAADEEDVALSAFHSFIDGLEKGRFPLLADRDDLWHLLIVITHRKAARHRKYEQRDKRDRRRTSGESVLAGAGEDASSSAGIAQFVAQDPTPEFATLLAEQYDERMAMLPDDEFRGVAELKFQGYENQEIATRLKCSLRSVERKLQLIRRLWQGATP
jgi:DNA-directed RNA polymerase specialized sigma24 family protein